MNLDQPRIIRNGDILGLKNNPSRDNSIGSIARLQDNQNLICAVSNCSNQRSGYSKYCLTHKNHIANTGSLEQEYIHSFKTILKPYVKKMEEAIKDNEDRYSKYLDEARSILNNPHNLNAVQLSDEFSDLNFYYGTLLSAKTISRLKSLKLDESTFLAVVIAVYIYQKENPKKLLLGMPLFFHIGKLMYSYTSYKKKLSVLGKVYYSKPNLTKNQYILLGVRLYSKFYPLISAFIKQYNNEITLSVNTNVISQQLRVKKTRLEELIEEKEERIAFSKELIHVNPNITQAMIDKQIIAIVREMDRLMEEERRNSNDI